MHNNTRNDLCPVEYLSQGENVLSAAIYQSHSEQVQYPMKGNFKNKLLNKDLHYNRNTIFQRLITIM